MILGDSFTIDNKFKIGEIVYIVVDVEQLPKIVTGIMVRERHFEYEVSNSNGNNVFAQFELSKDKTIW